MSRVPARLARSRQQRNPSVEISVIGKGQESAKLIFNRYGNRYFFAQAWVDGENSGLQAPKSRAERAAERELAGINAKTEAVALRTR